MTTLTQITDRDGFELIAKAQPGLLAQIANLLMAQVSANQIETILRRRFGSPDLVISLVIGAAYHIEAHPTMLTDKSSGLAIDGEPTGELMTTVNAWLWLAILKRRFPSARIELR
jgi:hypothetical protein